ncbi:Fic family protein MloA [uncultured Gammaproteobacteria bacterium]|nr:Fic family protein MloA [uncultured Gammaproteobacteria bacterium]
MKETQNIIKNKLPKIYSKDLIETLFNHPYTKKDHCIKPQNHRTRLRI